MNLCYSCVPIAQLLTCTSVQLTAVNGGCICYMLCQIYILSSHWVIIITVTCTQCGVVVVLYGICMVHYRDCLHDHIMASNDADVQCPCNEEFACGGSITELEMRAVCVVCVSVCVFVYTISNYQELINAARCLVVLMKS